MSPGALRGMMVLEQAKICVKTPVSGDREYDRVVSIRQGCETSVKPVVRTAK